jgi:hypothetical protein
MKLKHTLIGIAAVGGVAVTSSTASAQPNGLPTSRSHLSNIGAVRCVCDADFHRHLLCVPKTQTRT